MKQVYDIDPAHTSIGFAGRHMMVTTVRGRFKEYEGQVVTEDDDPATAAIHLTIRVASLDTGVDRRDQHLRSADFFDVDRYPEITFRSRGIERVGGKRCRVSGELTIKDRTRPLTLDVDLEERFVDPWGLERIGISASGKLDRKDWGLTWNQLLEAGRMMVGDEIRLEIESALVRSAARPLTAAG